MLEPWFAFAGGVCGVFAGAYALASWLRHQMRTNAELMVRGMARIATEQAPTLIVPGISQRTGELQPVRVLTVEVFEELIRQIRLGEVPPGDVDAL